MNRYLIAFSVLFTGVTSFAADQTKVISALQSLNQVSATCSNDPKVTEARKLLLESLQLNQPSPQTQVTARCQCKYVRGGSHIVAGYMTATANSYNEAKAQLQMDCDNAAQTSIYQYPGGVLTDCEPL